MDRTVADPMIGRVLDGRYRVGPRIARGGMATVYEATDLRLDRVCALKIMHAGLGDDDDFAGRFVREARSAARLSHPNVVGVFDQGDDDGTLFLAMEYVPGHTLRDLIRKEAPMSPAKALALVDPVLSALAAAHQAGMIHRDVKPENVLLADDGRVKVADFGLARAVSAETQHTATGGVLIGTVSYLSPELVVDGRADARSDVYAAGVVLYEMLTGRKPHEGDSPIQVAYKHVHEDVPPPSRVVAGIPPYVDALVARATARDRDLRPADARVLLHQVRRVRAALDHGVARRPGADLRPHADGPGAAARAGPRRHRLRPRRAGRGTGGRTILSPGRGGPPGGRRPTDTSVIGAATGRAPAGPPARSAPRDRPGPAAPGAGPLLLVLVLLLAVAAGVGGWWFGAGRYVTTPGVVNLSARGRGRQGRGRRAGVPRSAAAPTPRPSPPARWSAPTPPAARTSPATARSTAHAVARAGAARRAPAARAGASTPRRPRCRTPGLAFGDATYAYSEKVAKGVGAPLRPEGRHHAAARRRGRPGGQQGSPPREGPGPHRRAAPTRPSSS